MGQYEGIKTMLNVMDQYEEIKAMLNAHLADFYKAYVAWLDAGAIVMTYQPGNKAFTREYGLCANLSIWTENKNFSEQLCAALDTALEMQFILDGLDKLYPFGDKQLYVRECEKRTQHLNPKRVAWVRGKV
jgi:hypothetical protein